MKDLSLYQVRLRIFTIHSQKICEIK
jgi:hypothetical protein